MKKAILFSLFFITLHAAAQQKYKFEKRKMDVFEPVANVDSSYSVEITVVVQPNAGITDSLRVSVGESDASSLDYSITDNLPLVLLLGQGSQKKTNFYLQIKRDNKNDGDEDLVLYLNYKSRNVGNTADSIFIDTCRITIKELPKPATPDKTAEKLAELQKTAYNSSFILHGSSYAISLREKDARFGIEICKTTGNGIAAAVCFMDSIPADTDEKDFIFYFKTAACTRRYSSSRCQKYRCRH